MLFILKKDILNNGNTYDLFLEIMEDTVSNLTEATYNDVMKIMRNINLILLKNLKIALV